MRKQTKESGPITTFQIFALGGFYLARVIYALIRYFNPLHDDDGDGDDDEGKGVRSRRTGGIDYPSGILLSFFCGEVAVRSFVLLSCHGQQHHRKTSETVDIVFFRFGTCLSSSAPGGDCAGRGNGLSFFIFLRSFYLFPRTSELIPYEAAVRDDTI